MPHILLLEPDVKLAAAYMAGLQSRGHDVVSCTTAQDAILKADKSTPDIVLLELQLVAHSGIEFLYEFRSYADWRNVPVIVLSHVPPGEFTRSRKLLENQLGVRAYHYKPQTSLRTLVSAVEQMLESLETAPDVAQPS